MKSIKELEDKQEEFDKKYDYYKNTEDVDEVDRREKCIITGHWVELMIQKYKRKL